MTGNFSFVEGNKSLLPEMTNDKFPAVMSLSNIFSTPSLESDGVSVKL